MYGGADKTARDGRDGKCVFDDKKAGFRQLSVIQAEQQETAEQINNADGRNDAFAQTAYGFDPAQNDGPGHNGQ